MMFSSCQTLDANLNSKSDSSNSGCGFFCKSTLGGLDKLPPSGLANVGRPPAYVHCAEVLCTSGYGWSGRFNFHFLFTLPANVLGS